MAIPIVLDIQLGDANEEQRLLFDEQMRRMEWNRCTDSSLYVAEFDGADSDADLLAHVENELAVIAESCGICHWKSTAALG